MYEQFKFFLLKEKETKQRKPNSERRGGRKKERILSELQHKFNISFFLICGSLGKEAGLSSIGHHFCTHLYFSLLLNVCLECRCDKWRRRSPVGEMKAKTSGECDSLPPQQLLSGLPTTVGSIFHSRRRLLLTIYDFRQNKIFFTSLASDRFLSRFSLETFPLPFWALIRDFLWRKKSTE